MRSSPSFYFLYDLTSDSLVTEGCGKVRAYCKLSAARRAVTMLTWKFKRPYGGHELVIMEPIQSLFVNPNYKERS